MLFTAVKRHDRWTWWTGLSYNVFKSMYLYLSIYIMLLYSSVSLCRRFPLYCANIVYSEIAFYIMYFVLSYSIDGVSILSYLLVEVLTAIYAKPVCVFEEAIIKKQYDSAVFNVLVILSLGSVACVAGTRSWWRHQMETFSALLAICAGNSPVPGEFPAQRPVTRSFDVFFDLRLNKRLSKQSWGRWFETLSLWRHCNVSLKRNCDFDQIFHHWLHWNFGNFQYTH